MSLHYIFRFCLPIKVKVKVKVFLFWIKRFDFDFRAPLIVAFRVLGAFQGPWMLNFSVLRRVVTERVICQSVTKELYILYIIINPYTYIFIYLYRLNRREKKLFHTSIHYEIRKNRFFYRFNLYELSREFNLTLKRPWLVSRVI